MPPKKTEGASAPKPKSTHASYQDMITDAIVSLKDRNGSSRQSLKKYVKANNNLSGTTDTMFDSLFNKALRTGVEKGIFEQPKGASGGTKLAKKAAKPAPKKEGDKVKKPAAKPAAKKAAPKKAAKPAAPKKEGEAKKPAAKKAAPKKAAAATKPKAAKVTKPAAKKAAPKKAAPKKAAPKKEKAVSA